LSREEERSMASINHTLCVLAGVAPMAASLLGACASPSMTSAVTPPTQPAVTAPPAGRSSAPTNLAGTSDQVGTYDNKVLTYPTRVVTYPEGRFQLYGSDATGYYWVWIPTGASAPAVPTPPALPPTTVLPAPAVTASPAPSVVVARFQNQIVYPQGRYQLYGDATRGYYWVWIPAGVMLPYPPPQLQRLSRTP